MNSILLRVSSLLSKVRTLSDDGMVEVKLTLNDEAVDQGVYFPAFVHFEAFSEDGSAFDYECVDSAYERKMSDHRIAAARG
ncbi:MAG: hypothetical protein GXY20_03955, partial [Clostridiales bacterium]|nr:hypothetical protein [Clostridiales bacterium]